MGDLAEDLNYDYNYNMFLVKTLLTNLPSVTDQTYVMKWLSKLSVCTSSIDEMRLRNDFMYYLVLNVQNGDLRPPFNSNPPPDSLSALAQLLPGGADVAPQIDESFPGIKADKTRQRKPIIYQNSPDGGAFLSAQPIPRCGAFCYLAVVCKEEQ